MKLLDLQEVDSRLLQLRHRRRSLPQVAEIAKLDEERSGVQDRARDARILVDDLTIEQSKAEADVAAVRVRRERDRKRVDDGLVSSPKDLTRLNHELESLERRISTLEDEELEVMEKLEEANAALEQVEQELAGFDQRVGDLEAERDAAFVEIDREIAEVEATRAPATADIPADLLALYERLREQKGGLGAALLRARECGGCRLSLDHAELAAIKAASADEVVRCEDCQRILVRTSESGL